MGSKKLILFLIGCWCSVFTCSHAFAQTEVSDHSGSAAEAEVEQQYQQILMSVKKINQVLDQSKPIDGVTALVILFVASFVVDRLAVLILSLLSLNEVWKKSFPYPNTIDLQQVDARADAQIKMMVVYYLFATAIAIGLVILIKDLRLMKAVGLTSTPAWVDWYLTGFVIVAGSERVAQWLQMPGTPGATKVNPDPVVIAGEMVLRDPPSESRNTDLN